MRFQTLSSCALVGVALLFGASACGQKKIAECNSLIEVINKGVQSLNNKSAGGADPSGIATYKSMADEMDKVAADVAKIELSTPELKKFSADYQAMAKDVAKAARDLAAVAADKEPDEAKKAAKLATAQAAVEKAVKAEDPLIDNINKFCQSN